jgi:hypothetical protein
LIKKCDFKGCEKAGVCRAPRSRTPGDYYWFCKAHAAEYNKNWNYYAGMSADEIEQDWERENFGISDKDRAAQSAANAAYSEFLRDFLNGKEVKNGAHSRALPGNIMSALRVLGLPPMASRRDVAARYRVLAKKYHPDTARDKATARDEFMRISAAYGELKKHLYF